MRRQIVTGMLVLAAIFSAAGCNTIGRADPVRTGNVTMPNVTGKNAATATDTLERLGFADSRIKLSPDDGHVLVVMPTHWMVNDQSEKPGVQVSLQELIVLSVAKHY